MHKKISYGGMATAICVVLLMLALYVPSGKAAALFLASVTSYVTAILTDKKTAFISYGATSTLLCLIAPNASPLILVSYVVCFGNYPILMLILSDKPFAVNVIIKLLLYGVYFAFVYFICKLLFSVVFPYNVWLLFAGGTFVFAFYDRLLFHTGRYILARFFKSF